MKPHGYCIADKVQTDKKDFTLYTIIMLYLLSFHTSDDQALPSSQTPRNVLPETDSPEKAKCKLHIAIATRFNNK